MTEDNRVERCTRYEIRPRVQSGEIYQRKEALRHKKGLSHKGEFFQEQVIAGGIQKQRGEKEGQTGKMQSALVRKGIYVWVSAAQWGVFSKV